MSIKLCSVPQCGRRHSGRGYCSMHLIRLRKTGRLNLKTAEEKFWEKVERTDTCWLWRGTLYPNGYGSCWQEGKRFMAHRRAYELVMGPIPPARDLDHLCRNKPCVNPSHLEPVTHRVNVLRGEAPCAITVRTGRCGRGHAMDEANTYIHHSGKRECRTCKNDRWREGYYKRKAAA